MQKDKTIAISHRVSDFFDEVVRDALRSRQVETSPAAASYLVGVLSDFAKPGEPLGALFSRPLTFLLRDALETEGATRFKRLRELGDGVLYAIGFFGGGAVGKGVDRGYVVRVGQTAYDHASSMLTLSSKEPAEGTDVLRELSQKFERFAEVLTDVADATFASSAKEPEGLVKLYERWLKTGSSRLAEELGAAGLVPLRGGGGVH